MGSPLMSEFNWVLLLVYVSVSALSLLFTLLPTHFAFWKSWYAVRSRGVSTFMQPGWLSLSLLSMIAVLSFGVAGFLNAKLYYVDSVLATPAAAPVAGSPFAIQYNTETSWSSGNQGIYFDTLNSQYWTSAQALWLGTLILLPVWAYLFFAYHRVGFSLFVIIIATLAAAGAAVMMWLVSWIPGIPSVLLPLWLLYATIVNIGYVHRKETVEASARDSSLNVYACSHTSHRARRMRARNVVLVGSMTSLARASRAARPKPLRPRLPCNCSRYEELCEYTASDGRVFVPQVVTASASAPNGNAPGYQPIYQAPSLSHRPAAAAALASSASPIQSPSGVSVPLSAGNW
jgi:hypothetical protein